MNIKLLLTIISSVFSRALIGQESGELERRKRFVPSQWRSAHDRRHSHEAHRRFLMRARIGFGPKTRFKGNYINGLRLKTTNLISHPNKPGHVNVFGHRVARG